MNNIYVLMTKAEAESTIVDVFASLEDAMKTKHHIYKQCIKDTPLDLFIEEIELKYAPNFGIKLNTYLETQPVIARYNMLEK